MTLHFSNLNPLAEGTPAAQQVATVQPANVVQPVNVVQPANLKANRRGFYRKGPKRVFETVLILLALPIVLPVMAAMMLAVMRDGASPFYTQTRIGQDGRRFKMWKMRTMVPNAEAEMARYLAANPAARAEWDRTQKLKDDPRVTRVGRLLRRTSLDELPQLWNVLGGSMALVGPRPMMESQETLYAGSSYYNLRPGITGFWQVSDRNESEFAGRVKHDDAYDAEVSFGTDVQVLVRTMGVVLRCTGY